jgi:hypothetical protein
MTAAQKARLFGQLVALLDSPNPAERVAALEKLTALRPKMGWLKFIDLLLKLESTVTAEEAENLEKSLREWMQAHSERVTEIAALRRVIAARAAQVASLKSALWFSINWRRLAALSLVLTVGYGSWRWSNAEAAPDRQPVPHAAADNAEAAIDTGLRDLLSRTKWGLGDTTPVIITLNGTPYWVVIRGITEAKSHSDTWGRPIERHCLALFASEARRDAGAFLTPAPYLAFGRWMRWPQRAAECRMPGGKNY